MDPIKVQVKQVKNLSGQICLAAVKDVEISDTLTLKKDVPFFTVSGRILKEMTKPHAVNVKLQNGLFFVTPIMR